MQLAHPNRPCFRGSGASSAAAARSCRPTLPSRPSRSSNVRVSALGGAPIGLITQLATSVSLAAVGAWWFSREMMLEQVSCRCRTRFEHECSTGTGA